MRDIEVIAFLDRVYDEIDKEKRTASKDRRIKLVEQQKVMRAYYIFSYGQRYPDDLIAEIREEERREAEEAIERILSD